MTRAAVFALFTLLIAFVSVAGQVPKTDPAPDPPHMAAQRGAGNTWTQDQLRQMEKAQKLERQKQLKVDTDKLLTLATELKESVDKTNENVLSVDVVRKAEEIEKLAKHIKNNMR